MIDCQDQYRLNAYHDGQLAPAERAEVESHLRDCASCAAELTAIRRMSVTFAANAPIDPVHDQLLHLAQSVRGVSTDARMLLTMLRRTAVAAALLLACTVAAGVYQTKRTKAAAHETMILDHVAIWSQRGAFSTDLPTGEEQVAMAQWIAYDLRGRQEER